MKDFSIKAFMSDESGATAIEYAIIAAGVAAVIVSGITILGQNAGAMFNTVAENFE